MYSRRLAKGPNGNGSAQPDAFADAPRTPSAGSERTADVSGVPVPTAGSSDAAPARRSEWREVTIPAGTRLPVLLQTTVGTDISRAEETVQAHLARAIGVHPQTAQPRPRSEPGLGARTREIL